MRKWLLRLFWWRYPAAKQDQDRRDAMVEQAVTNLRNSIHLAKQSARKADAAAEQMRAYQKVLEDRR